MALNQFSIVVGRTAQDGVAALAVSNEAGTTLSCKFRAEVPFVHCVKIVHALAAWMATREMGIRLKLL